MPQNSFHKAVNVPDVVVFPSSQDEVQKIVMTCNKYKFQLYHMVGLPRLRVTHWHLMAVFALTCL
uniref:Uncharacterized protein n=1 Tax=Arundo donax TaxID=35708 RepID=A0A0A9E0R3_ARUDO